MPKFFTILQLHWAAVFYNNFKFNRNTGMVNVINPNINWNGVILNPERYFNKQIKNAVANIINLLSHYNKIHHSNIYSYIICRYHKNAN